MGTGFVKKTEKNGVPEKPQKSVPKNTRNGSQTGGGLFLVFWVFFCLWTLLGPRLLLERSWTSIFHHLGFVLSPNNMFWCPWIRLFRVLFVVVSGCFLGRVHGGAQIVPEENRKSSPLSKNVFWCCLQMILLAEYWGCCENNFRHQFKDKLSYP